MDYQSRVYKIDNLVQSSLVVTQSKIVLSTWLLVLRIYNIKDLRDKRFMRLMTSFGSIVDLKFGRIIDFFIVIHLSYYNLLS